MSTPACAVARDRGGSEPMAQADEWFLNHVVAEGRARQERQKVDGRLAQQGKSWWAAGKIKAREKLLP